MTKSAVGYLALLRRNRAFRRLWYGQVVSQLGDWFDVIALFTLLLKLTGSGEAVGLLLVAQFLPAAIVSSFAGVVIDRLPRKLVLVASDIGRAVIVLLLLLVRSPEQIWLVYLVVVLKFSLTGWFEPARSAIIPSLVRTEELVTANGLSGATWSVMLAVGSALGGIVVGTLGVQSAFVLDSASFGLSALLIAGVPVVEQRRARGEQAGRTPGVGRALAAGVREFAAGLSYILRNHDVFWYTLSKALWHFGGGVLLLLTLFGREIFPIGLDGAVSIGLLYTARGLGAALGPLIAQRLGGPEVVFLRRSLGIAFFVTALGYVVVGFAPTFGVVFLAIVVAHMGGSIEWVFSTTLLQMKVPDGLRGRVFAVEFAALTLTTALSSYLTGVANDAGWTPRTLALLLALVFVITGVPLLLALWTPERIPASVMVGDVRGTE